MSVYAVHYTWVQGHAMQGPVGVWGADGRSYYPSITAAHANNGAADVMPIITQQTGHTFESWLEMRGETAGTNTNWRRVDSMTSMREVLDGLQQDFFSEQHPVKPTTGAQFSTAVEELEEPHVESAAANTDLVPAHRRINAESWWIASELAARHPDHLVTETHPGGGMYDVLALVVPGNPERIRMNRGGSLTVGRWDESERLRLSWPQIMAASSPHGVVKHVEAAAGLTLGTSRPPTSRRTIVYRFIASFLAMQVNNRHAWDCRSEYLDSSDIDGGPRGYVTRFPAAEQAMRRVVPVGMPAEPHSYFWALLREGEPVAILSLDGTLFEGDRVVDLLDVYQQEGRSATAMVASAMKAYLR
ncbi:hypothetical protein C5B94_08045 [Clavibacter michiganensis]|uniref:TY-Chap2 family putative peptide chaperone n=1 Tax=Clavibacter michiganensis TaxID=28447 RepID=UPI000CE8A35F|nr:hypothetical protein [Clavibacter michiganensis]PPF54297.1 hypothetical protein C5B94_08045 [Clavibacter michiganensis]